MTASSLALFLPSFLLLSLSPSLPPLLPPFLPPSFPSSHPPFQTSFVSCSKFDSLPFNSFAQGGYVSGVGVGGNVASVAGAPGMIGGAGYVKLRFIADKEYEGKVFHPSCLFLLSSFLPFLLSCFFTFLLFYFLTFPIHYLYFFSFIFFRFDSFHLFSFLSFYYPISNSIQ